MASLLPSGGGGWRAAAARNLAPSNTTRAKPGAATLETFLRRQPAAPPPQATAQTAANAEQVNAYLASLGLPPVPPGVDPMAAMIMAMQYAPLPQQTPGATPGQGWGASPPFDPWAAYYADPWAMAALYDPFAAYYAPQADAPLAQWEAEQIYTTQPSAWASAYGGSG